MSLQKIFSVSGFTPEQQFNRMTTESVPKLVTTLAIPTVISMLVSSIYNMADTFFVSRLGTSASAAVGIVFSIMAIIQAIGFTLGMGSGSRVSKLLGEKNQDEAEQILSIAFTAALIFGLLITIVGLSITKPLMKLLGATETIMPYAIAYGRYIFIGAPVMCASFVLNNVLRSEGHAAFSMVALTLGGVLNIALDPLFIFGLKLGTAGAAIATLISQTISFVILLSFFLRKKSIVSLKKIVPKGMIRRFWGIITLGLPSLCRQGLATVSSVLLNRSASVFGDAIIAGMSIVTRIIMMVASVMIGIGQGFTPVAGYNYGAKKYNRVRKAYRFTVVMGFCVFIVASVLLIIFAPNIIRLFRNDSDVVAVGVRALRYQSVFLPLHAFIVGTNMLMQSTGKSLQATFLSCNRQGVYFLPLIFILPRIWGLTGVEITQALADFLSFLTAIPYIIWFFKKLRQEEAQQLTTTSDS